MKRKYMAILVGITVISASFTGVLGAAFSLQDALQMQNDLLNGGSQVDLNQDKESNGFDFSLMKRVIFGESANEGEVSFKNIAITSENAKLMGRTTNINGTEWLVQSGASAEFSVTGTTATLHLAGDGCCYSDEKYRPRYAVFVDDELIVDELISSAERQITLFEGDTQRTAKVKVIHLSEANNGAIGVTSVTVETSASKPIVANEKKNLTIEFIGDSITCAYGVEGENQYENFRTETENFMKSYAYLTAGLLDADYSAVSYSGHGIISGYSNDGAIQTDSLVPPVYSYVGKIDDYKVEWDFESHPSDVVVINLGTNDDSYCGKDLETRGEEYQKGYLEFLGQVREKNPNAKIICTLGIMGCQELYPYIENAVAEFGDANVTCYESPTQNSVNGYGSDWHPSEYTHQQNAYLLADKIATALGMEWSKIGLDMVADGTYGMTCDKDAGANASDYFNDWDSSLWISVVTGGTEPSAVSAYVKDLTLPAGDYTFSFDCTSSAGVEIPYLVRNADNPDEIYVEGTLVCTGSADPATADFSIDSSVEHAEILFYCGGNNSISATFRNLSLLKTK